MAMPDERSAEDPWSRKDPSLVETDDGSVASGNSTPHVIHNARARLDEDAAADRSDVLARGSDPHRAAVDTVRTGMLVRHVVDRCEMSADTIANA